MSVFRNRIKFRAFRRLRGNINPIENSQNRTSLAVARCNALLKAGMESGLVYQSPPFLKGDLGGFAIGLQIPPGPPLLN